MDAQWTIAYATIFLGIATFFAVFVALFGDVVINFYKKPKIKFELKNGSPNVVYGKTINNKRIKYFCVRIINNGKSIAKNCRMRIISALPEGDLDTLINVPDNLKWSSAPLDMRYRIDPRSFNTIKVSDLIPIFREFKDIPPFGGWEFCDLFKIIEGEDQFTFTCYGGDRSLMLGNGSYKVIIEIFGENLKPKKATFRISNPSSFENIRIEKL